MKYREKLQYAEKVAEDLLNEKCLEKAKEELQNQGLYENDVSQVITSAITIVAGKLTPSIRPMLLSNDPTENVKQLKKLHQSTMDQLIEHETKSILQQEKSKVTALLTLNVSADDIYAKIRQDFYPKEKIENQIMTYQKAKQNDTRSTGVSGIVGGIGMMLAGIACSYATLHDGNMTLFYGLLLAGFSVMMTGLFRILSVN